ncbi:N-acetylmuramic acid 6-phosphate etherase [Pseudoxanthomonas sp. SGD-10]|nr:N-acetylmuramic acid 6-phosphate etherase [Pseudoxanthomonas sp. SGD-10]
MNKITESESTYRDLDKMSVSELLTNINKEDMTVPQAVNRVLGDIEKLVTAIVEKMSKGGRLFYIGAGTSGRLGVVDASECPPTFGVDFEKVIGIIAGGDGAIRRAVEFAEDDTEQAWKDLEEFDINQGDVVIGIAASGYTPYVVGGLEKANEYNITTGCVVCNTGSPIAALAQYPVEVVVGPEFITGSTRMKAGTAQKLVLNMISTTVMIKLGHVQGNKMVDMQLTNVKLFERGARMIVLETGVDEATAKELLGEYKSVRKAVEAYKNVSVCMK